MNPNLKIFFGAFLLSLPLWWSVNFMNERLVSFFLWSELANTPQVFTAQAALEKKVQEVLPLKKNNAPLYLNGASALSVFVNSDTQESKVLFEKNTDRKLGIASLTKLMGALVIAQHYSLNKEIQITREAVLEEESFGQLREGDRFSTHDLLYPLLMESSNDASAAFALEIGKDNYISLMNKEAAFLGLQHTSFVNHAGLDPDIPGGALNYSTARDLFVLTRYLKSFYPSVFEILGTKEQTLYTTNGRFHHVMQNTNELLSYEDWPTEVLGGKTGWTPEAQGALVLVLESPKGKGYLLNIILGSTQRFQDMERLVTWAFNSHTF